MTSRTRPTPRNFLAHRWVLGEPGGWATDWVSLLDRPGSVHLIPLGDWTGTALHALHEWPEVADLEAIDFFCGTDPGDPAGEDLAAGFIAFVQALTSHRIEQASRPCRLTVVTRRAAHTVEDARGGVLWGAVRSMALEIGEEAKIDFRLVDLGDHGDLDTLAWLARCDLRERELAVRKKSLWAPRMVSVRERYLPVPTAEGMHVPAHPRQRGTSRWSADEDLRTRRARAGGCGDRRNGGGPKLPRRHGDPWSLACAGLRTLGSGTRDRHGGQRSCPSSRIESAALPCRE